MPNAGGQGQQLLGDAGEDPGHGTPAVCFEVQLTFEGLVDRLDPLAYAAEVAVGVGLVLAVGAYALWRLCRDRWGPAAPLYLSTIALVALYTAYADIIGMPRYALTLIPGFWMLADATSKPYVLWAFIGTSLILALFSLTLFVNWWYVY